VQLRDQQCSGVFQFSNLQLRRANGPRPAGHALSDPRLLVGPRMSFAVDIGNGRGLDTGDPGPTPPSQFGFGGYSMRMDGATEFAMIASQRGGGAGVPVEHSVRVGISFGLTSGVITTLGLLVGLSAGTSSRLAVIGGVFTIAVADSLSDALGIHVSEEAEGVHSKRDVWISTIATFASKLSMALTFAIPVILLDLDTAVGVSILWGALALSLLSWNLARSQGVKAGPVVTEHLVVAAVVITASYLVGRWISSVFS